MTDVERMLRSALVPVDPPGGLTDRLEEKLVELHGAAEAELADWELGAMRDPRNWARPAGAAIVGGLAGGALILIRARQQQRRRNATRLWRAERELRALADTARRLVDR